MPIRIIPPNTAKIFQSETPATSIFSISIMKDPIEPSALPVTADKDTLVSNDPF